MKLKILYLILIFVVSIMFTANYAFADGPIVELNELTENCAKYAKEIKTYSIIEKYPEFDEKNNQYIEKTIKSKNKIYTHKHRILTSKDLTKKL